VKRLLLLIVVVVALGAAYLILSLDARVARAIEDSASRSLGASVRVDGVDLALSEGRGTIRGLHVANPEGFSDADAFRFDEIELAIEASSLGEQPFRISRVRIGRSHVRFEVAESGDSNIEHIVHHLSAHAGKDEAQEGATAPQRVAIEELHFEGGEVLVWREDEEEPERVDLPDLEMEDVGGDEGATGAALSREIARVFTRRVVAATAGHELGRAVGKELGDAAGEVAETFFRNILD
jgi:hypothetical protein